MQGHLCALCYLPEMLKATLPIILLHSMHLTQAHFAFHATGNIQNGPFHQIQQCSTISKVWVLRQANFKKYPTHRSMQTFSEIFCQHGQYCIRCSLKSTFAGNPEQLYFLETPSDSACIKFYVNCRKVFT